MQQDGGCIVQLLFVSLQLNLLHHEGDMHSNVGPQHSAVLGQCVSKYEDVMAYGGWQGLAG